MVLESAADGPPREVRVAEISRLFDDTVGFWQSWLARSTYSGRWREMVERSAITLKLGRADGRAARAGRRRTQLGLPLHVGARCVLLGVRAAQDGLRR